MHAQNPMPRRLRLRRDDTDLPSYDCVDQSRLAYVRPANYSDEAAVKCLARHRLHRLRNLLEHIASGLLFSIAPCQTFTPGHQLQFLDIATDDKRLLVCFARH